MVLNMKNTITTNAKAVVSSRGQVVIPILLRDKLGIHEGSELFFNVRSDGVMEVRRATHSIESLFGCCKRAKAKPMTIAEMDEAIMQAVSEKE